MRVATIDIGTNTVLLLVAERNANGVLVALAERATITRLGAGVDRTRQLAPDAVARTCACLAEYAGVVRAFGADRIAVVGTSAMRDATGGEIVRAFVKEHFGVDARVLSGAEEARLTFSGATSGLNLDSSQEVAVFDIGGGSTEIALGRCDGRAPSIAYAKSFDVGSVRLTERHLRHDPPATEEREAVLRAAHDVFAGVPRLRAGTTPVGVAGTMTTLAAVALGVAPYNGERVHGQTVSQDRIRQVVEQLASIDVSARRALPGMDPMRADVIVAGGFIALALLGHWNADAVVISDRGVRWGLAEELGCV